MIEEEESEDIAEKEEDEQAESVLAGYSFERRIKKYAEEEHLKLCCCCGIAFATRPNGLCGWCADNCTDILLKDKPCITTESCVHIFFPIFLVPLKNY